MHLKPPLLFSVSKLLMNLHWGAMNPMLSHMSIMLLKADNPVVGIIA